MIYRMSYNDLHWETFFPNRCLAARIPVYDYVQLKACVRVLQYPSAEEQNGQEGIGLFFSDTMAPDSVEQVENFNLAEVPVFVPVGTEQKLDITLEKRGMNLYAEVKAGEGDAGVKFETHVDEEFFFFIDSKDMVLGFFATRGYRIEVDPDSVSVEYLDQSETGAAAPILYASPEGEPSGQGSQGSPLDLQSAVNQCERGQEVRVLPGRYRMTEDLVIAAENSGSSHAPKKLRVETRFGENAVLDFGGSKHGFRLEGSYWEIRGLTVTRGFGFQIQGSHNRVQDCQEVFASETELLIGHPGSCSLKERNDRAIRNGLKEVMSLRAERREERQSILVLCSSFYGGGAERVACRLASRFAERYQVYYLYIRDKGQSYPLDPRVQTIQMPFFWGDWDAISAGRAEFVRKVKDVLDIHTAISLMYTMNKANVQSGGSARVICSERNNPMRRYPERMAEIDDMYAAADHVVFQSETVRSMFSQKVRAHGSIILNPVEVSCGRTESRHRIVTAGRLVPQKNHAMLIRAFADFYQSHQDYTLSLYGSGELAEELRALAASLGIGDAVQFHGQVWDVHRAIADAEMFVLSSDYEGLSNALLESMMMGLPCISTRCEGSVDVIRTGENGILVDVGSQEQMTNAMMLLADDVELREKLGVGALKSCEPFRTETVMDQWYQLIEALSHQ